MTWPPVAPQDARERREAEADRSEERAHGCSCTSRCGDLAIPSPLQRPDRPPAVPCRWCGALSGVACTVKVKGRDRPLTVFGRFHGGRLEEEAA